MKYYKLDNLAVYGGCNYGEGAYQDNETCATTTAGGGTTSGGGTNGGVLTNTGFEILLAVIVAGLILVTAAFVRFVRKPKTATEAVAASSDAQPSKE